MATMRPEDNRKHQPASEDEIRPIPTGTLNRAAANHGNEACYFNSIDLPGLYDNTTEAATLQIKHTIDMRKKLLNFLLSREEFFNIHRFIPSGDTAIIRQFHYATKLDWFYMFLAGLVSILHGTTIQVLLIVFGNVTNLFTNRSTDLCMTNSTSLSQLNCSSYNQSNIEEIFPLCNFTRLPSKLASEIGQQSVYIAVMGCIVFVFGYIQDTLWALTSERQTFRMRQSIFRLLMRQNIEYFDTHHVADMNTVLMENINKVKDGLGHHLGTILQCLATFLAGFIIGLIKNWKLSLVLLSFSPILITCLLVLSKMMSKMITTEISAYAKAGTIAQEVLSSIRMVFAYNGMDHEYHRYTQNLHSARKTGIRKGIVFGIMMGFIRLVIFVIYAVGFIYGTHLIQTENSTIGDVFVVFFGIFIAVFSLGQATNTLRYQNEAICAVNSVRTLLNLDVFEQVHQQRKEFDRQVNIHGDITFDNVSFAYPSRPNSVIISNVTFHVKCGETVAIVGSNGSGKSSCLQLLQGFYEPTNGSISLDGIPLDKYDVDWLRENMSVVSQDAVLFSTSIRENIMCGNRNATVNDMLQVAKLTNLDRIVERFPQGYDTIIGDNSNHQLSGGQKQLICVARALIKQAKLMLLDECTSALDYENESNIMEILKQSSSNRTTIIITHRISTIRHASRILVMQDGRIVEQGTHEELIAVKNVYYNMVHNCEQNHRMIDDFERVESDLERHENNSNQPSIVVNDQTDTTSEDRNIRSPTWYMLKLNRPEWLYILFGCVASFCTGGFQPAVGILISKIIAVFQMCSTDEQKDRIGLYVLIFFIFAILIWITVFLQNFLFAYSGESLIQRIRSKLFKTYMGQEISWFDDPSHNTGSLCLQLSSEASAVQKSVGVHLGTIFETFGNLGTGTVLSFVYGWELTLVIIGFLPFLIISGVINMKLVDKYTKRDLITFKEVSQLSMEVLKNIRTVRQLTKEDDFILRYETLLSKPHRLACKRAHLNGFLFSFSNAMVFFAQSALTAFAVFLVTNNRMTFENVLIVFNCILLGAQAAGQTVSISSDYGKALRATKNIIKLFEAEKQLTEKNSSAGMKLVMFWLFKLFLISHSYTLLKTDFQGNIELSINSFAYPARPNVSVLKNLQINIRAGQSVALVGLYSLRSKNGCGKSTIMQLIQRFYDVYNGHLLIDSTELRHLNLQWYRSQIGYLSQTPVLFNITIEENIAYGDLSRTISQDEIIKAAKDAHAHSFIDNLPEKYKTMVGPNAERLSGGQRQSIALARLFIRNPRILLLDECTSAMDHINEKAIENSLSGIKQNRTSIVIGHHLSSIQHADIIYVIHHQGHVVESGTHETLMAARGYYYKLALDLIH
ncbi:unnamed protein product [Adineta ricciae]|uniref:Uncharacterized protein n=1 Tax=Adineta ricciae TaxID=249248 RepID=A0A815PWV2_ADIRI|nr:unnamed protein product [Adineta ricciae]